ncbi:MAG: methylated-DNA--[Schwartzia sp.]|nr:methylated-DNA--[protein]-cysteine S-methyltransferase [Schwartzia sp. (in: firmicutes)]MBR1885188.1 methylated-DNA--[protein]-cysteine S-methyltransferase [Schwartzia sp. (in: firmicutes)]
MKVFANYASPLGNIVLSADDEGLTGLGFAPETGAGVSSGHPALREARRWLALYFSGRAPGFTPPLHLCGTPFRMEVWKLLLEIPYGETTTYGALAKALSARRGGRMAAQAVGGAVGRNPVPLIVPCHR